MVRIRKFLVLLPLCLGLGLQCLSARAEQYLTAAEAQRICFPQADRFEDEMVRLTPEKAKAIEKRSGVKVVRKSHRMVLAFRGRELLGVVVLDSVLGKHELIDYALGITPAGRVQRIEILAYRESYGGEIRAARWREQFKGKSAGAPLKLNEDIYNVSGATMSCRHVTQGVKRLLASYEEVVLPRLRAAGRLPDAAAAH